VTIRRARLGLLVCGGLAGGAGCAGREAVAVEVAKPLFEQSCANCHGDDGRGHPPVYPPLAGNVGRVVSAPGGRDYLVRVPLYGTSGPIEVDGEGYSGSMASFASLEDAELAGILNYMLQEWGAGAGAPPIQPAEIARARRTPLKPADVRRLRPVVGEARPGGRDDR
jgi:mono/diheme cytochrome c family protein